MGSRSGEVDIIRIFPRGRRTRRKSAIADVMSATIRVFLKAEKCLSQ
jgi:hypothetical protein